MQLTSQIVHSPPSSEIPQFPEFRNLTIEDKNLIEDVVSKYPAYSDYNFVSLWSYNVNEDVKISQLHDNLIIRFADYLTQEPFYSYLGTNEILDTTNTLLTFAKSEGILPELKLVPEVVIATDDRLSDLFTVKEDIDNFDYIYSIEELCDLKGKYYNSQRNHINKFKKNHSQHTVVLLDLTSTPVKEEIMKVFAKWEERKGSTREDTIHEFSALERFLQLVDKINVIGIGIYLKKELIGFSIDEILSNGYAINHFEKADTKFPGTFQLLKQSTAQHLQKNACNYLNCEQDLGLVGLREAKTLWRPALFLKKFIISERTQEEVASK